MKPYYNFFKQPLLATAWMIQFLNKNEKAWPNKLVERMSEDGNEAGRLDMVELEFFILALETIDKDASDDNCT